MFKNKITQCILLLASLLTILDQHGFSSTILTLANLDVDMKESDVQSKVEPEKEKKKTRKKKRNKKKNDMQKNLEDGPKVKMIFINIRPQFAPKDGIK